MSDLHYRVVLEADPDDGGFNVRIPAFPTTFTCGESIEEALAMAKDAIELEIQFRRDSGIDLPDPDADSVVLSTTITIPAA